MEVTLIYNKSEVLKKVDELFNFRAGAFSRHQSSIIRFADQ